MQCFWKCLVTDGCLVTTVLQTSTYGMQCNLYNTIHIDWTPQSGLQRWTTVERNCLPGFSSFGNINGCYKLLGGDGSWAEIWQNASDACDSLGPNVHLAGLCIKSQLFID